jgi:PAS domain S-box-containing protein
MWVNDPDGNTLFLNQAFMDYSGLSREASRLSWRITLHPDEVDALLARRAAGLRGFQPYEHPYRLRRFDGEYRWHFVRVAPVKDDFGKVVFWVGSATDIHDRQCAEIALLQNEEELEAMFEMSGLGKAVVDPDTLQYVRVNQRMCEITGYSRAELLRRRIPDITHPDDRAMAERVRDFVQRGINRWSYEKRYVRKNGAVIWVNITGAVVRDGDGRPRIVMADIEDVTARRELNDVRGRLAAIVENSTDSIGFSSLDDRMQFINPAGRRMLGFDPDEEVTTRTATDFFSPEYHSALLNDIFLTQDATGSWQGEIVLRHLKTGAPIPVHMNSGLLRDGEGRVIGRMAICRDLREQKRRSGELDAIGRRFQHLTNAMSHMVWIAKAEGDVVYFNERWTEYTGQPNESALGWGFSERIHPDDVDALKTRWTAARQAGGDLEIEHRLRGKSGDYRWFLGRAQPVLDAEHRVIEWFGTCTDIHDQKQALQAARRSEAEFRALFESAGTGNAKVDAKTRTFLRVNKRFADLLGYTVEELTGKPVSEISHPDHHSSDQAFMQDAIDGKRDSWTIEKRYIRKDGRVIWTILSATVVRGAGGEALYSVGVIQDITQKKEYEAQLLEAAGTMAQSNDDLERFAFVASHDLQEPLRKVSTYTSLLFEKHGAALGDDAKRYMEQVTGSVERMRELINDLLDYSRLTRPAGKTEAVDLEKTLSDVLNDLEVPIRESGAVVTSGALPTVNGSPTQLNQVFQNLIGNAIKFRGAGAPRIRVDAAESPAIWTISISDNGIGIEPEHQSRIFGSFERLHPRHEYPGSGIGLATCKKIVEQHGGRIGVRSTPGAGSTFFFTLPRETG